MSITIRPDDQVLRLPEATEAELAVLNKYDAFLSLLSGDRFAFQREAIRTVLRYFLSPSCGALEQLASSNWRRSHEIRSRWADNYAKFLDSMPLRAKRAASLDLATGTGKSFVLYGIAAIAIAEGLCDQVLVLCPSVTIEEGLLSKFARLAGDSQLAASLLEVSAKVAIPRITRADQTILPGDICVENIHAVYAATGSSIRDSLRGRGARTLVLNDEAHHLGLQGEKGPRQWLRFLQDDEYGFDKVVGVTGTPYVDDEYFSDILFRYGLRQAIANGVVKKPNYKLEETCKDHTWDTTYELHAINRTFYSTLLRPITLIVVRDIATCVEVYRELVVYLCEKDALSVDEAENKVIWVSSAIPNAADPVRRIRAAYRARNSEDSPEKRRLENLQQLKLVDDPSSCVEWIVSVSMLSEGWDVRNVFQIVPHESRAFQSKLLISQVLGRGLRVPPECSQQPFLRINNHEAWSDRIAEHVRDVLEEEATLTTSYQATRNKHTFPVWNLRYKLEQYGAETKRAGAKPPKLKLLPQERVTRHYATFSETGITAFDVTRDDDVEIVAAVRLLRMFLREKNSVLAGKWPAERLRSLITESLANAGQDETFLSKRNFLLVQQAFGPMLRVLGQVHPRIRLSPEGLYSSNTAEVGNTRFSEGALKQHGHVFAVCGDTECFSGKEGLLWKQYLRLHQQYLTYGDEASEAAKAVGPRLHFVTATNFISPTNAVFVSHEPERLFCELMFFNHTMFQGVIKMPNSGGYAIPYSYKPTGHGRSHVKCEMFHPDFFMKLRKKPTVVVVETKTDDEEAAKSRAKLRDAERHFAQLNERLRSGGHPDNYVFKMLGPDDYPAFFERLRKGDFESWQSALMQKLKGAETAER